MTSSRIYLHYLNDIYKYASKAIEFVQDVSAEDFLEDDKTVFAVIRALEVVGEATKSVSDDVRNKYPEIPWRNLAGMRDKLIHHYFGVDLELLWTTVNQDLPQLLEQLDRVLAIENQENKD